MTIGDLGRAVTEDNALLDVGREIVGRTAREGALARRRWRRMKRLAPRPAAGGRRGGQGRSSFAQ